MEAKENSLIVEPIPFEKAMEEAYKQGMREIVETYKRENPGMYKKYEPYWEGLKKEKGLKEV